ncbi:T9SS type A sorting domain-containing protein [bacterium AH-315-M05]|nr:T9SS type A sorting domain-containing protein [bacterium AH-315-M05]
MKTKFITAILALTGFFGINQVYSQCTFSDDYTTSTGWTQVTTLVSVTGGVAEFNNANDGCCGGSDRRIYKSLGCVLSDTAWTVEFDFRSDAGNNPSHYIFSVSDTALSPNVGNPTSTIGVNVYDDPVPSLQLRLFYIHAGTQVLTPLELIPISNGVMYYIRLERTSFQSARLGVFSDPARTSHIAGSPICLNIPFPLTGLKIIQHSNSTGGSQTRTFTGIVDNTVISNGVLPDSTASATICDGDSIFLQNAYQKTTGVYYDTLLSVSGCDSVIIATTLTVNPTYSITDLAIAICNGDSISIYGTFRSVAGTYYDSLLTVGGCDSVHSTILTANPIYSISDSALSICNGDSISIYGTFRSVAATYYDSSITTNGCDSIHSTTLTVNPTFSVNDTVVICNGDSALLAGAYQMVAGSYIDTNTTVDGCDSIVTTELIVNPIFSVNDTIAICNGDSTFLAGAYQMVAGSYIDTNTTVSGCDSIVTTELIVNPIFSVNDTIAICTGDSTSLAGAYQMVAGSYIDTNTTVDGCDSIVTTELIVNPVPTVAIIGDTIACSSILLDEGFGIPGDTYLWSTTETTPTITVTVSGTYSLTVTGVNGCQGSDSINVTVNPTYSITDPAIDICYGDSVLIYGTFRSVAGIYYNPLTTINGCDSTRSTVLTVVNSIYSTNTPDKSICSGDSVMIFSIYRSVTGTYYDSLTTVNGCDSVIITSLTVYVCTGVENLDFINSFKIYPNPNAGEFTLEINIIQTVSLELKIVNSLGQELFTEELKQFKGPYEKQLDLNEFPAGIYTLQLLSEKGVINKKIVIE